jgi:hypothetical protein
LAVRWLSGDAIEAADASRLGLAPGSPQEPLALPDNQRIKLVFVALSQLALISRSPFVLCFDQVDNLDHDQLAALSRFVHDLLDHARGLLVITSGNQETLQKFRQEGLVTESAWHRLAQYKLDLKPLREPEARAIIASRLQDFMGPFMDLPGVQERRGREPLFPLSETWWQRRLEGRHHFRPREIINWAGERWEAEQLELAHLSGEEWLAAWPNEPNFPRLATASRADRIDSKVEEKLAEHVETCRQAPNSLVTNADHLCGLVLASLKQCAGNNRYHLLDVKQQLPPRPSVQPAFHLAVRLQSSLDEAPFTWAVLFLATASATSTTQALQRLLQVVPEPDGCLLVTDERQPLALGANQQALGRRYLEQLKERGSCFATKQLTFKEYAQLDALQAMVALANSGDLEIEVGEQGKYVTEAEVIASHNRCGRYEAHPLLRSLLLLQCAGLEAPPPVPVAVEAFGSEKSSQKSEGGETEVAS